MQYRRRYRVGTAFIRTRCRRRNLSVDRVVVVRLPRSLRTFARLSRRAKPNPKRWVRESRPSLACGSAPSPLPCDSPSAIEPPANDPTKTALRSGTWAPQRVMYRCYISWMLPSIQTDGQRRQQDTRCSGRRPDTRGCRSAAEPAGQTHYACRVDPGSIVGLPSAAWERGLGGCGTASTTGWSCGCCAALRVERNAGTATRRRRPNQMGR